MHMTVKLYDTEPYSGVFKARVLSSQPLPPADGGKGLIPLQVELDRTLFFPEEGGQLPDTGTLNGYAVTDVQISGDVIRHTVLCTGPDDFAPGTEAEGVLDWETRFSKMQNHTGEHILSGLLYRQYGYRNIGFRLSDNTVSFDTSGDLTREQILQLERDANAVVFRNVPVTAEYPDPDVLAGTDYRSKMEIDGPVRLVTIQGVDVCACCAPHVARTGEIGLIKILRAQRFKGGTRLFILCGRRALEEMQRRQTLLEEISHMTNRPQEEADDAVRFLLSEIADLRAQVRDLEYKNAFLRIESVDAQEENVFLFAGEMDAIVHRNLVNRLCEEHPGYCGVFCGSDEAGYRFIIGRGSQTLDCRIPCGALREKCGAKGGGKPEMVQGSAAAKEEVIRAVLDHC